MKRIPFSGLRRITALGLGIAMVGGLSFVAAAPASAVPETYILTGSVVGQGLGTDVKVPLEGADVTVEGGESTLTNANGEFSLSVVSDTLAVTVDAEGYQATVVTVTMPATDLSIGETVLQADEPEEAATYTISGVVTAKDANPAFAPHVLLSGIEGSSPWQIEVGADGSFSIPRIAPGADLELLISAEGYGSQLKAVPVTNADVTVSIVLLPAMPAGTVTISGTQAVGSTLTAVTAGWPAGTTFTYAWGAVGPHARTSGDIFGENSSTLPVTADIVNKRVWVQAIGHLDGFAENYANGFNAAPRLPIATAPVADSANLAAFLAETGSTPASQVSVGLPAGDLNPGQSYTANVPFDGGDTFVDAYVYSSPISVGTFPVVNGVAQITLSASVLGQLAAGSHTLVVVGQFSGAVSSVALSVGAASTSASLAETGFNAAVPFGAAALFLLLGAAALVLRRRSLRA